LRLEAGAQSGCFNLWEQCRLPQCQPGTVVEIAAGWSGNDLPGTAELRGKTYPDLGGQNTWNSADVRFSGGITMPPMRDGPVSITALFDFAGRFVYAESVEDEPQDALLTGGGRVTLFLEPYPGENSWVIRRVEFEFRPVRRD
jgi:hypothetical protein